VHKLGVDMCTGELALKFVLALGFVASCTRDRRLFGGRQTIEARKDDGLHGELCKFCKICQSLYDLCGD
jgi:hypothetical protein